MKWFFYLIIISLLLIFFIGAIKRRWKRKHNEKLTIRKLFKKWGQGIDGITARQIAISQLWGSVTILCGIIFGVVASFFIVFFPKINTGAISFITSRPIWFFIVMLGSLVLTILQLISSIQKYHRIKLIDEQIKKLNKK